MDNVGRVKGALRRLGTSARKGLGQNFLVDEAILEKILEAAHLSGEDVVIEVGPGTGILTQALAERCGLVIAVELDDVLASALEQSMAARSNVRVVHGDIMRLEAWREAPEGRDYKVVANLPYYIASATLTRFLEFPRKPELMVAMMQKEVAEEIVAGPGKLRFLSVLIQFYSRPEIIAEVPPSSFYPPPKVGSAILRLTPHTAPAVDVEDPGEFLRFVAAGFRQPRKQLSNSLSHGLGIPAAEVSKQLRASGIDQHRRAETLTIQEWAALFQEFHTKVSTAK